MRYFGFQLFTDTLDMCIPSLEASRASSLLSAPSTVRDLLPACSSIQVLLSYHCSVPGLYSLGLCQQNLVFHICEKNMKIKLNSPPLLHGLRVTGPLSNKGKEAASRSHSWEPTPPLLRADSNPCDPGLPLTHNFFFFFLFK